MKARAGGRILPGRPCPIGTVPCGRCRRRCLACQLFCLSIGECISYREHNSLKDTSISIHSVSRDLRLRISTHQTLSVRYTTEKTPRLTKPASPQTARQLTKPSGKTCIANISTHIPLEPIAGNSPPGKHVQSRGLAASTVPSVFQPISRSQNNKTSKSSQQNHLPLDDLLAPA